MQVYLGYGFDVSDIKAEAWIRFLRQYNHEEYANTVAEVLQEYELKEGDEGFDDAFYEIFSDVGDYDLAEMLAKTISECERHNLVQYLVPGKSESDLTDDVVISYSEFVVFDSVRFANDTPRTKYIKTEEDFIEMIARYIDLSGICFGNIYCGCASSDDEPYMD